tara:strand:+ start:2226 stop:2402 length:177 start_codon:yes stop_codon:yes gene_type:complete
VEGSKMLIASPPTINECVKSLHYCKFIGPSKTRYDLLKKYKTDETCPFPMGIFLQIIS